MVALGTVLHGWAVSAVSSRYWGQNNDQYTGHCDLSNVSIPLPDAQLAVLGHPNTSYPTAIGVAFGVQNYTCSQSNNFTSTGAVAQLYDISCLYYSSPSLFSTIQEPLYNAWVNLSSEITVQQITAIIPFFLSPEITQADHYFISNPAGAGLSPVWDFRATQRFYGQEDAIIVGKGVGSVVPPVDPADNINWLRVGKVSGDIANEVYRIDTIGGQPPTSCTYGQTKDISVRYASQYWFYGGSLW